MRSHEWLDKLKTAVIPLAGLLFLLWYIRAAGADVVYSDYIRLIDDYLPDVADSAQFMVPDILTRIPAAFLARLINVRSFGYSVTFDRMLTLAGFGLIAIMLYTWLYRQKIGLFWQILCGIVLFSLGKWEILLNGTAWAHVVSFGLFFASYRLLDLLWTGEADAARQLLLLLMPFLLLLFAGEYIASYAAAMMLVSVLGLLTGGANSWAGIGEKSMFRACFVTTLLALGLYLFSRHYAVWEHAGSTELGLVEVVQENPLFLPKLFIKSFAGAVIGQETAGSFFSDGSALPGAVVLAAGIVLAAAYLFAFVLYFADDMMERTVFPLVLLISGLINHLLVTAGRWIFLRDDYAMSSRYGVQFMTGLLGMLLIFGLYAGEHRPGMRRAAVRRRHKVLAVAVSVSVFIAAGNCYTTYQEIRKAPYREANYERMAEAVLHYEEYDEETLLSIMEWHKDPAVLYRALGILKENHLNVYRHPLPSAELQNAG